MSNSTTSTMRSSSSNLHPLNYLNVFAYIGNVLITYGFGVLGWLGAKTNSELSEKYQTLVTPAGWAFGIWSIIFISQFIFVVIQLQTTFRSNPLVQEQGVNYNYVGVCLAQMGWTIAFSLEYITVSLGFMMIILAFLVTIVSKQRNVENSNDTTTSRRKEFWLLKFPFNIHCGWIVAASFVNFSVFLVNLKLNATLQVLAAIFSLVGICIAGSTALFLPGYCDYVIPSVLVWATAGIFAELSHPKDQIVNSFPTETIWWVRMGSVLVGVYLANLTIYAIAKETIKSRSEVGGPDHDSPWLNNCNGYIAFKEPPHNKSAMIDNAQNDNE